MIGDDSYYVKFSCILIINIILILYFQRTVTIKKGFSGLIKTCLCHFRSLLVYFLRRLKNRGKYFNCVIFHFP